MAHDGPPSVRPGEHESCSAAFSSIVPSSGRISPHHVGMTDVVRIHHLEPSYVFRQYVRPRAVPKKPSVAAQSQYAAEDYLYEERLDWAKLRKLMRIPSNLYNILQVRGCR